MINWFTLMKKLMQTSIVIVSGSIINASTVQLNGIWHLIWHYISKPVLGGHYSIPRGCPLNASFTVTGDPRNLIGSQQCDSFTNHTISCSLLCPFWNHWWSLQADWLSAVWFIHESLYFLLFIMSILKSLVIPSIWLALSSVIYSRITLFLALNHICSKSRQFCF